MNKQPLTRNVTRLYRQAVASNGTLDTGWYARAQSIAARYADTYGVTVEQAAGVIAAVSPLNSWKANLDLAAKILARGGMDRGYLKIGLKKCHRILAGEEPSSVLTSDKVGNFYQAILSGGQEGICIDRHAWSIATNQRYTDGFHVTKRRYRLAAETYRRAAKILSAEYGMELTPAQVQSVTWVYWRNLYWSEGAFDPREESL